MGTSIGEKETYPQAGETEFYDEHCTESCAELALARGRKVSSRWAEELKHERRHSRFDKLHPVESESKSEGVRHSVDGLLARRTKKMNKFTATSAIFIL
jgi:hypothetical protein